METEKDIRNIADIVFELFRKQELTIKEARKVLSLVDFNIDCRIKEALVNTHFSQDGSNHIRKILSKI